VIALTVHPRRRSCKITGFHFASCCPLLSGRRVSVEGFDAAKIGAPTGPVVVKGVTWAAEVNYAGLIP
jgi:hypothetical protein